MKKLSEIAEEERSMTVLSEIASSFEGVASLRIAAIKDQVIQSTKFYHDLWKIYVQVKAGNPFSFGRSKDNEKIINKKLFILITAEGGFSGDIDLKLINMLKKDFNKEQNEIIVIGHHGAIQLAQSGIEFKKYYKLPSQDRNINVAPLMRHIRMYKSTVIYYQSYVSLMDQQVNKIELSAAITDKAREDKPKEIISEETYIFEPSTLEVVAHLERSMIQIILGQLIFESKLAQYASRFRAMTYAREKANEMKREAHLQFNRSKRAIKDERLKEIINGMKRLNSGANS